MAGTPQTHTRDLTTLFAELAMRTLAVSVSGAAILIAVAIFLFAPLP